LSRASSERLHRNGTFALLRKPVTGTMLADQVAALLGALASPSSYAAAMAEK
jgi:hypothetical protein